MASLLLGLEKSFHSFEEISQESMRNHSRKLQSLRKKRSLSGRPPRFQSCCTWPVSIWRPKGREGSMPSPFWPLLCSAHPLQAPAMAAAPARCHLQKVGIAFLSEQPWRAWRGCPENILGWCRQQTCSSPPSPPGYFSKWFEGGLLAQLQTILKPVFSQKMYHYWKNKY